MDAKSFFTSVGVVLVALIIWLLIQPMVAKITTKVTG